MMILSKTQTMNLITIYALFDLYFLKSLLLDCEEAHREVIMSRSPVPTRRSMCMKRLAQRTASPARELLRGCFYFGTLLSYPPPSVVCSVAIPGSEVDMKQKLSFSTPKLSSIKGKNKTS